jgi:hypothetical protein
MDSEGISGALRLQVDPPTADVLVDGHYAGIVGDFDGHFHHLKLRRGAHHMEIREPGYQPLEFDIVIEASRTTTYRGTLLPLVR